ncbi:unnamed protein product [Polarella glacialis]|uniref:C3H1-type domain-containing protein n=1 Tax=Polarella glacialis TaxID=89957 RepID=A0A813EXR5_POLGL|nr:unnamed protein product [Polarella glacialis]
MASASADLNTITSLRPSCPLGRSSNNSNNSNNNNTKSNNNNSNSNNTTTNNNNSNNTNNSTNNNSNNTNNNNSSSAFDPTGMYASATTCTRQKAQPENGYLDKCLRSRSENLSFKGNAAVLAAICEQVPLEQVALDDNNELTSIGSKSHPTSCSPCVFYAKTRSCFLGIGCGYCHLPHVIDMARLRKKKTTATTATATATAAAKTAITTTATTTATVKTPTTAATPTTPTKSVLVFGPSARFSREMLLLK